MSKVHMLRPSGAFDAYGERLYYANLTVCGNKSPERACFRKDETTCLRCRAILKKRKGVTR